FLGNARGFTAESGEVGPLGEGRYAGAVPAATASLTRGISARLTFRDTGFAPATLTSLPRPVSCLSGRRVSGDLAGSFRIPGRSGDRVVGFRALAPLLRTLALTGAAVPIARRAAAAH